MDIKSVFEERKTNPIYNTSYPLKPEDWAEYRHGGTLDFSDDSVLAFYIHIPFCMRLCKFCEYSRMFLPDDAAQRKYIETVDRDVRSFTDKYPDITLNGFDIGGGTPTSLSDANFNKLLTVYKTAIQKLRLTSDFEPSVEATFHTISKSKAEAIVAAGIQRVSLGMQTSVSRVQQCNNRENPDIGNMDRTIAMLHKAGIKKVNIDLMYGLDSQTLDDIEADLQAIKTLDPEQVTLYEFRPNMVKGNYNADKDFLFDCYSSLYEGLTSQGYQGRFGQNTFTKDVSDKGLSSYLRHRMIDFSSYKGFGVSAQSKSEKGMSYNVGKLHTDIKSTITLNSFGEEYCYDLPLAEMLYKYLAVSAYYGQISISTANRITSGNFLNRYEEIIAFCLRQNLFEMDNEWLKITEKGFKYYGAVFSLFRYLH